MITDRDLDKIIASFSLLSDSQNLKILRALVNNPGKAKDLESSVGLDSMTIKRRLYKLVESGLVNEEKVKTKNITAIVYHVNDKAFPSLKLMTIIKNVDEKKIKALTKVFTK